MEMIDVRVGHFCQLGGKEMPLSLAEGGLIYTVYGKFLLQRLKGFSLRRDASYRRTHPNSDKIASCGSIVRFFNPIFNSSIDDGKLRAPDAGQKKPTATSNGFTASVGPQKGSFWESIFPERVISFVAAGEVGGLY